MSEEIKNANESVELSDDQLEDVAGGGCGDMPHDKRNKKLNEPQYKPNHPQPDYNVDYGHKPKYPRGGHH